MDINTIIREEVEKYILTENIASLSQYSNQLTQYVKQYAPTPTKYQEEKQFMNNFTAFAIQIIHAVNRCVRANTLTEANRSFGDNAKALTKWALNRLPNFNLRNYGINVPKGMGGGFFTDAYSNYYKLKNFFGNNNSANGNANVQNVNNNLLYGTSRTKLSVLLQQIPQYQRSYQMVNAKYSNNLKTESNGGIEKMFGTMIQLQKQYNILVQQAQQSQNTQGNQNNAQGNQNP